MTNRPHPGHEAIVAAAVRSPSAHNAQPWRLAALDDGASYELHYDANDYLPYDPEDRDAGLAMGGFYETMSLAAEREGMRATFEPHFTRDGSDLFLGVVRIGPRPPDVQPTRSPHISTRGSPIVSRTTAARSMPHSSTRSRPLGCTFRPLGRDGRPHPRGEHARVGQPALRLRPEDLDAMGTRRGRTDTGLPGAHTVRHVRPAHGAATRSAPAVAVAGVRRPRRTTRAIRTGRGGPDRTGHVVAIHLRRRSPADPLLGDHHRCRSSVSSVVDRDRRGRHPTEAAKIVGATPLAMFRMGYPSQPAPMSGRRPVEAIMREATGGRQP